MRAPRPEELRLMATLRDGPKPVRTGPVGRCVKRGWCSVMLGTPAGEAIVLYSLTDAGRALLDAPGQEIPMGFSPLPRGGGQGVRGRTGALHSDRMMRQAAFPAFDP